MDVSKLYESTKTELDLMFKRHNLHGKMQPVDKHGDEVPAVYLAHHKVTGSDSIYSDGGPQQEKHYVMFILVCDEEDLTPCRRELSRIYGGLDYKESGYDRLFTALQFKDGERADMNAGRMTWYEVYGNSVIGAC